METKNSNRVYRRVATAAILTAAIQSAVPAVAGTTTGEITISTSGSTALKNWFVKSSNTFTDVQPGTQLTINGATYPASLSQWSTNGGADGNALAYQLAPLSNGSEVDTGLIQQAPAIRFEYHESGSVEGILELANDQIGPVTYITQNVDRNPSLGTSAGNAVWVNYNQFGGGKNNWTPAGSTVNNNTLGDFYSSGQTFTLGGAAQPSFSLNGTNLSGGQNAVQLAVSDVIPQQAFLSNATGTNPNAATPWLDNPSDPGYGGGNTLLPAGNLGTPGFRAVFQSTTALNMPATATDPRTGNPFGTGPWNTAGLGNLNSNLVAITATLFVANPGTGLTQVNRTDAQWLQLQSRLANGATFNMTTRDVNSGTRNVAALETGIDPTWATGMNDNGNGNASNAAVGGGQISIGPNLRFSNKTAGGNELRPTVESARMAVGTLSINDAHGFTFNSFANPIRALSYSNTDAGTTPNYVAPSYANIIDGAYTIFQNEQFVTLQAPDSQYGTSNPNIQGDSNVTTPGTGDVKALINNTLNSVAAYDNTNSPASPAAGLMANGYILPQLMQVRKNENGGPIVPNTVANGATPLTAYNSSLVAASPLTDTSSAGQMANADPSTVLSGASVSVYGGNSITAGGPSGVNGSIFLTGPSEGVGNYLFGNFNQNGVRDFDSAVVEAQKAQAALDAQGGDSMFTADGGLSNSTKIITGIPALDTMQGQTGVSGSTSLGVSKGDLIAMGDYNGDGKFDGSDLYALAFGASLTDAANMPSGTPGTLSFHTGTMATSTAASFGGDITNAVLNKNAALDYLQAVGTTLQKQEARVTFTVTTGSPAPTYAGVPATLVATNVSGNDVYTLDDANGDNAFNKADVNHDGQINLDDALIVDKFAGESYNSQNNQQAATIGANGTIDPTVTQKPISLVAATLIDYGSNDPTINKIQQGDENVASAALDRAFNYAWYNGETKVGPLAISLAPAVGSTFQVPTGATFTIAAGAMYVGKTVVGGVPTTVANTVDPFTDSSASTTTLDTSKSLAITVGPSASLNYAARTGSTGDTGIKLYRLGSLTVQNGGVVGLDTAASHSDRSLLVTGSTPTFTGTGKLDLGANDMVVHNGNVATIQAELKAGFNAQSGYWNGSGGILSTEAATDTRFLSTLGYRQSGGGSFDTFNTTSTDVLVKYTYYGDANLDGTVDGSDYHQIDNGFGMGLTGWSNGDFNYDGVVNGLDYALIDNTFNQLTANTGLTNPLALLANNPNLDTASSALIASPAGVSAVPEPGSITLLTIGAAALLGGRRRRS